MLPRWNWKMSALIAGALCSWTVQAGEPIVTLGRPVALNATRQQAEPVGQVAHLGRPVVRAVPPLDFEPMPNPAPSQKVIPPLPEPARDRIVVPPSEYQPSPDPARARALDPRPTAVYPGAIRPFPQPMPNPNYPEPPSGDFLPPPMIGDLPGYMAVRQVQVKTVLSTAAAPNYGEVRDQYTILGPMPNRGAFKIAENESPLPQDRAYVTYNYFQGTPVRVLNRESTLTLPDGRVFPLRSTYAGTLTGNPDDPLSTLNSTQISNAAIHREVLGVEKTLFDGLLSVGLRLPFFNLNQTVSSVPEADRLYAFRRTPGAGEVSYISNGLDTGGVGDLSILVKFALLNDPDTGSVLSTGLMTTVPSGEGLDLVDGTTLRSALLQPFVGWLTTCEDWYLHGFFSILVGTDEREPLVMFNDIGVGYLIRVGDETCLLRAVIPTLECHVTTPLRSGDGDLLQLVDLVTLTGGVHFDLACNSLLTVGGSIPLTGPRPFSYELAVYYNYRW